MNKKNTENQEIKDQTTVSEDVDTSATDNATSDNMADQTEAEADTVAEKSAEELIDWKDQ